MGMGTAVRKLKCYAFWLAFLSSLLLFSAATFAASGTPEMPETYQVTAQELTELQSNLDRLSVLSDSLQQTCGRQKNQIIDLQTSLAEAQRRLAAAQKQQTALQLQIRTLTENSQKQEALLTEANESLKEFSAEQKRTRLRIKAQRHAWQVVAGLLVVGLAVQ